MTSDLTSALEVSMYGTLLYFTV